MVTRSKFGLRLVLALSAAPLLVTSSVPVTSVAKAQTSSGNRNALRSCSPRRMFTLGNSPDTIIVQSLKSTIIPQNEIEIPDLSVTIKVPATGVIDVSLKVEAKHRGDGYSEVIGFGTYMTYQYDPLLKNLDSAQIVRPMGWVGGTNIRDLRDHYGQINIVSALGVIPGYYRICLHATAHSTLSQSNSLAEILVEGGGSPLNTLRLSYKPGGRLLQ